MNAPFAPPSTAIIGAGIAGLTAGKMLGDYGVPYTCFESSDRIGGNWAFGNPNGHSSAYRSLHIDTSKYQLSFKDFPIPDDYPDFPHHSQIKAYLDAYADAFDLLDNIEFGTQVVAAERRDGGGWTLRTRDGAARDFDFLIVANGHHWDPRHPDFPGRFDGRTLHSHHYIDPFDPIDLRGQRILVVGIGNSAADIAVEVSSRALRNTVYLSTRTGSWIVPKYMAGRPVDKYGAALPFLPRKMFRGIVNTIAEGLAGDPTRFGLPKPPHRFMDAHGTQSVELPLRLGSGDVIPKPNIARLDGSTVHFADDTFAEVDVIINATGYNITFPFFDPDLISAHDNRIRLYKRIFKPGVDDLAFAGLAQSVPTLFPFVECQARLIAAYAAGQYRPPTASEMEATIDADEQMYLGHVVDRPRHTQQVEYFTYERQVRVQELPEGRARVRTGGPALRAQSRV
ncbi:flavin-containing monooxygenase [Nocardia alba]|uniref:Cation diffusion facilitator CzcD-associated flavoprotein CzcO n=1 Tax=Nocardia alba TaxID=225051 RepID=A0A4R1FTR9_9NOCA|nr:NAD(P)-binding domain-containing protein [Nocardia alba]TCJ97162.1 cation diffusion facilitator CzcD-associated flavoprotein CzcO [Nocardia alba]